GKLIRWKGCGQVFAVRAPAASKSAAVGKKGSAVQAAQAKPAAPAPPPQDAESEKNPYKLTDIVLATRCPQCAAAMESPEAVVCLNCGYNTSTRRRMTTIRTYAHTPLDWLIWLAPGILCALG